MSNVNKLPDAYQKDTNSNNYKLLHINELAAAELAADITDVRDSLNIKQAFGKTLDLYGAMFKEQRKGRNDADYRAAVETAIAKTLCGGDCNSVELLLSRIFGCPVGDVMITDHETPFMVKVQRLPVKEMREAGLNLNSALQLIDSLLPIGVFAHWYNRVGTFEFGTTTDEYDESAGLGNIEQTVGGYLGLFD